VAIQSPAGPSEETTPVTGSPETTSAQPVSNGNCPAIPAGEDVTITPACIESAAEGVDDMVELNAVGTGFGSFENVMVTELLPNGLVRSQSLEVSYDGEVTYHQYLFPSWYFTGQYTLLMEGEVSKHKATGHFYVQKPPLPDVAGCPEVPAGENVLLERSCFDSTMDTVRLIATGFDPSEYASVTVIAPDKTVAAANGVASADDYGNIHNSTDLNHLAYLHEFMDGIYEITIEGNMSQHNVTGYFYFKKQAGSTSP
jgi:hypothetical protein